MIIIKNKKQITGITKSCRLAAITLNHVSTFVAPGITTNALNDLAHQFILDHHATPAPLGYKGFPKSVCTSVNNVVCHGIPNNYTLKEGDIINIDITTILNGYYGDTSATFPVGKISQAAQKLIGRTQKARDLSIKALKPGKILNDCVGRIIEPYVTQFGYSVVRDLGGHGVGLKFHEDPHVYHYDQPENIILKPGMIFTVEPMINASPDYRINIDPADKWTVSTKNGALSAQFEHTVLITPSGHQILTL